MQKSSLDAFSRFFGSFLAIILVIKRQQIVIQLQEILIVCTFNLCIVAYDFCYFFVL